jgi:hypothetical protein
MLEREQKVLAPAREEPARRVVAEFVTAVDPIDLPAPKEGEWVPDRAWVRYDDGLLASWPFAEIATVD